MEKLATLLFFCCFWWCATPNLTGQTMPPHLAIPVQVSVSKSPPSIRLDWKMPVSRPFPIWVMRKMANDTTWAMLAELAPTDTTFTDLDVKIGDAWEYLVRSPDLPLPHYWWRWVNGQVYAGIETPPVTAPRGRFLLLLDASLSAPLAAELAEFQQNIAGDGWQVVRVEVDTATATVPSVKALVRQFYEQDTTTSRTVLLFGNLPVPYSGFISPDGHNEDHRGAWPTDFYYADMDETPWTDTTDYMPQFAGPRNQNHFGDGKFDPDEKPSLPELDISRVDFSNLHNWDVPQIELYRRYLQKNLAFRTGEYRPPNRTIVDDEFRWYGQVGFAVNGYRNGHSLTGANNVMDGEWFRDSERDSFLFGYACGGGYWTGAIDVGSSEQYITDTVNVVFSLHFGSYFGDWDYERNPFMPAALASKGSILTTAWGGYPNWHLHHMALGMPMTYSMNWLHRNAALVRDNQVYSLGPYYLSIHIGMLGDHTLRLHYPKPPRNPVATATCENVKIHWAASPEASHGYLIYRSATSDGVFELLAAASDTVFTDNNPLAGANFYQIKTLHLQHSPTGTYFNQSIGQPAGASFSPVSLSISAQTQQVSCFGESTGAINLTVDSPTQDLEFEWSNGATSPNLDNLPAGSYTVTVTVDNLCTATASVGITQPSSTLELDQALTNPKCAGSTNGKIVVSAAGGTPQYQFLWSNGATSATLENLPAGAYSLTLTDAAGCSETAEFQLTEPDALELDQVLTTPKCHGSTDGKIVISATGGTPQYQFLWSNEAASATLENLPAGAYSLTLTDAAGCSETAELQLTEPDALELGEALTNPKCHGSTDGKIVISATGGTPQYQFLWSNGAASATLENLPAGAYSLTLTDAAGCSETAEFQLTEPDAIELDQILTNPKCHGSTDGKIVISAAGGTPQYQFLWSNGATSAALGNLPAGAYSLTLTDAAGCSETAEFQLTEPDALELGEALTTPKCHGTTDGKIVVSATGGTPQYQFLWSNGATSATLGNLSAGAYSLTLTDAAGCSETAEFQLTEPEKITIAPKIVAPKCHDSADGQIGLDVSGGAGGYTFLWSDGTTADSLGAVAAGTYSLTVSDATGCKALISFIMSAPTQLVADAGETLELPCVGSVSLSATATGGSPPIHFLWSNGSSGAVVPATATGQFFVTATDANGCAAVDSVSIVEVQLPDIQILGADTACIEQTAFYTISGEGNDLTWTTFNGGQVLSGSDSLTAAVLWAIPGLQQVQVAFTHPNGCQDTAALEVWVDICVSTGEPEGIAASVLPNPFAGYLQVNFAETPATPVMLQLTDGLGRVVLRQQTVEKHTRVATGVLPAGGYVLQVSTGRQVRTWKVVKF